MGIEEILAVDEQSLNPNQELIMDGLKECAAKKPKTLASSKTPKIQKDFHTHARHFLQSADDFKDAKDLADCMTKYAIHELFVDGYTSMQIAHAMSYCNPSKLENWHNFIESKAERLSLYKTIDHLCIDSMEMHTKQQERMKKLLTARGFEAMKARIKAGEGLTLVDAYRFYEYKTRGQEPDNPDLPIVKAMLHDGFKKEEFLTAILKGSPAAVSKHGYFPEDISLNLTELEKIYRQELETSLNNQPTQIGPNKTLHILFQRHSENQKYFAFIAQNKAQQQFEAAGEMDYSTHRFHCYYAKECSDGSYQSLMEYSTPLFEKWEQTDRQFRESQRRLKVLKEEPERSDYAYGVYREAFLGRDYAFVEKTPGPNAICQAVHSQEKILYLFNRQENAFFDYEAGEQRAILALLRNPYIDTKHAQKAIAAYSPTDGNLKESVAYIKPKTAIVKRSKEYGQSLKKTEAR